MAGVARQQPLANVAAANPHAPQCGQTSGPQRCQLGLHQGSACLKHRSVRTPFDLCGRQYSVAAHTCKDGVAHLRDVCTGVTSSTLSMVSSAILRSRGRVRMSATNAGAQAQLVTHLR